MVESYDTRHKITIERRLEDSTEEPFESPRIHLVSRHGPEHFR